MSGVADIIPSIAGLLTAVTTFLVACVTLYKETDVSSRKIKRLSSIIDIYLKLPENSGSKSTLDEVITHEVARFEKISTRKVNMANAALAVIIAILGSAISYLFALWASNSTIIWTTIAWILFTITLFMTIGLVVTGLSKIYEKEDDNENHPKN